MNKTRQDPFHDAPKITKFSIHFKLGGGGVKTVLKNCVPMSKRSESPYSTKDQQSDGWVFVPFNQNLSVPR